MSAAPFSSVRAAHHMAATADQAATQAAMQAFALGGNASDAAIAANAVLTVTAPHLCGLGGDLFALVHHGTEVHALNASGRAGSGATADALVADGLTEMPFRHDIRSVTMPGCVDGWIALHERFGSIPLDELLAPATRLAEGGFPASPLLVGSLAMVDTAGRRNLDELASTATRPGQRVTRAGVARTLRSIGSQGRDGFYLGEFGEGLVSMGGGWFDETDLQQSSAEWVTPLRQRAWGVDLHTIPPNSQGYLTLATAALLDHGALPVDPDSDLWAHLLIEATTAAAYDRPRVLHDQADGAELLAACTSRRSMINRDRASTRTVAGSDGDTTYLCTADRTGMAVSLIQSNASGFGSWLVEPRTGINLHNRGLGFSLDPTSPAVVAPGRRPPHTLSPLLVTSAGGALVSVLGTMGGDAQPQILAQIAARLLRTGQPVAAAIHAARWVLRGNGSGFDTWSSPGSPTVLLESHAPSDWAGALAARGHHVVMQPAFDSGFGHAHAIVVDQQGFLVGSADPRARIGSVAGL